MRIIKKILKVIFVMALSIVLLLAAADAAWIFVPQCMAQSNIEGLSEIAHAQDAIRVAPDAAIIALGEASHGNAEFQELKLSVLQQLVERQGVRAFALEVDFGEGMAVNRYVHGVGEIASAEEAVHQLSFNIYHTKQMIALVQWMHDYNTTATQDETLSFFGFDLQNPKTGIKLLLQFCEDKQILPQLDKQPIQAYVNGSDSIASAQARDALLLLYEIEQALKQNQAADLQASDEVLFLLHIVACVRNFVTCQENGGADNYIQYNNNRDAFMAETVLWLADYIKARQGAGIMIAGHNAHVAFAQQFYTPMGSHLRDALGSAYFVIGTDYYKTTCNINVAGPEATRGNYKFCSADILAANAKRMGGSYYLDFSEALAQGGEAASILNRDIYMGNLGEGYTRSMHLLPMSHRIKAKPVTLYDAMLLVYEATPIEVG